MKMKVKMKSLSQGGITGGTATCAVGWGGSAPSKKELVTYTQSYRFSV